MDDDRPTFGERAAAFGLGYQLDRKSGGLGEARGPVFVIVVVVAVISAACWFVRRYPKTSAVLFASWVAYSGLYHLTHDVPPAQFAKSVHYVTGWPIASDLVADSKIGLRIRNDDPSYTIYAADAVCHIQWINRSQVYEDAWDLYVAYANVGGDAVAIAPGTTQDVTFVSPADDHRAWATAFSAQYDGQMQHPAAGKTPSRVVRCFLAPPSTDGKLAWQAAGRVPDMGFCAPTPADAVGTTEDGRNPWCRNDHYFYHPPA